MKKKRKPQPPRRLTPREADAMVADLTPAQRTAQINRIVADLRAHGVACVIRYDANQRQFLDINMTQMRARMPHLATLYDHIARISPEPVGLRAKTS